VSQGLGDAESRIAEIEETTKTTVAALVKLRGELDEVKDRNGETPDERPV